jgi:hypothetical protein
MCRGVLFPTLDTFLAAHAILSDLTHPKTVPFISQFFHFISVVDAASISNTVLYCFKTLVHYYSHSAVKVAGLVNVLAKLVTLLGSSNHSTAGRAALALGEIVGQHPSSAADLTARFPNVLANLVALLGSSSASTAGAAAFVLI